MVDTTQHTLSVLDRTGDTTVLFRPDVAEEVDKARTEFDTRQKEGYLAYQVPQDGEPVVVRDFDPSAPRTVMSPQLVGG